MNKTTLLMTQDEPAWNTALLMPENYPTGSCLPYCRHRQK